MPIWQALIPIKPAALGFTLEKIKNLTKEVCVAFEINTGYSSQFAKKLIKPGSPMGH
jgi:hypothetical protein